MKTIVTTVSEPHMVTGTIKWLHNEINRSEFYFSSTKDGYPCICWKRIKNDKDGNLSVKYNKVVAFNNNQKDCDCPDYVLKNSVWVIYPESHCELVDGLFPYLTPAATTKCREFLNELASLLKDRLNNDNDELNINVTVTNK